MCTEAPHRARMWFLALGVATHGMAGVSVSILGGTMRWLKARPGAQANVDVQGVQDVQGVHGVVVAADGGFGGAARNADRR